eukprot:334052_1
MADSECDPVEQNYRDYIYPAVFWIAAVSMVIPMYSFTKTYCKKKLGSSKLLCYLGMIFYVSIFAYYFIMAIANGLWCQHTDFAVLIHHFAYFLYPLQGAILVIILFSKLVHIFKDTQFQLSSITIYIFIGLTITSFTTSCCGQIMARFLPQFYSIGVSLWILSFVPYILTVIWLNCLFIYKVFTVFNKSCQKRPRVVEMLNLITKTALLSFISTLQIVIFMIFMFLNLLVFKSIHFKFLRHLVLLMDLHTNFLSVFLSYKYYHEWYMKLCGCCHSKCFKCWTNCFGNLNEENIATEIQV